MTFHVALGIGAGLVAALLFASIGSGSIAAVLLMYLSPLPILIVALGWHHLLGLLALSVGAITTSLLIQPTAGLTFALGPALCGWAFAYLANLRRPSAAPSADTTNAPAAKGAWYPVGGLLLWLGVAGAAVAVSSIAAATGADFERYREALVKATSWIIRREFEVGRPAPLPFGLSRDDFVDALVALAPGLLAAMLTLILTVNLWLAARVVAISGRLARPWPDLPSARMPPAAIGAALAGLLIGQSSGFLSVAGGALAGGLIFAFALQGLALMHAVSRHRPGRTLVLSIAYLLTLLLGYAFLPAFALLGMADSMLPLRRALARAGPPSNPPTS